MKRGIKIKGSNVHEVGYRPFLFSQAFNFGIKKFEAYNGFEEGKQVVVCLLDAEEGKIKKFLDFVKNNKPAKAGVEKIEDEAYEGEVSDIYTYASALNVEQLSKGIDALFDIRENVKEVGGKVDNVADKVDKTREELADKIDNVAEKVDNVADKVDKTREELAEKINNVAERVDELKTEHIKTRELSHEIFYAEVQELRHELGELRAMVEEIKKKVGIA